VRSIAKNGDRAEIKEAEDVEEAEEEKLSDAARKRFGPLATPARIWGYSKNLRLA